VFEEAIKNVDTSYMLYKKSKNAEGICWAVVLAAWIYEASGNHEKAFELARESLNLAIKNNDDLHRRAQLSLIGDLFRDIEDYKTALEYYRQSSKNAKEGALGYAELFTLLQQYDSAKYYYRLVDTTSPRIRRAYLTSIGEYYFEQKLYDKALPNFTRALDYHKQLNDGNPVMQTLVDIAKTYLALGNNDSAFAYGHESFIMAKQTGARQVKKAACEILSAVYYHRHQGDSAYLYYKQYTSIKDSVLNDQVKGKLAAYTFEQKMELLNKEKQLQQMQLQEQSFLKNILIGSIIILLLLAVVIFRNIILKRRYEKQRLEQKLELQQLESKIESQQALLNERLRISRELHDDIGSTLGSISIYSEVAKKHTEKRKIQVRYCPR
jgi:tetratricopeptide (TPR) repeat protein